MFFGLKCGDPGSECGDPGSECGDPGSECGDLGSECGDPGGRVGARMQTAALAVRMRGSGAQSVRHPQRPISIFAENQVSLPLHGGGPRPKAADTPHCQPEGGLLKPSPGIPDVSSLSRFHFPTPFRN